MEGVLSLVHPLLQSEGQALNQALRQVASAAVVRLYMKTCDISEVFLQQLLTNTKLHEFCSQNIRSLLPLEKVINTFADQVLLLVLIEDFTLSLNNTIT